MLLKSHDVFKSHDFRHFELNTIPCPSKVWRPQSITWAQEDMQGQAYAVWMWPTVGRLASALVLLLLSSTDIGREAGGLEPRTSTGKGQVVGVQTVRPGAAGAPGI